MKKLTLIILSFVHLLARAQSADSLINVVDNATEKFMSSPKAVGVVVGIYRHGAKATFAYGVSDKEAKQPVSSATVFNIASLSKTFTGLLLAQAAIEHKLNMNDDIRKYLDGDYPNLQYNGHPIQVEHLISHLSRLPFNISDKTEEASYTKSDFYADLHKIKIDTMPGIKFKYSNAAVILAGYILEKVYSRSLEDLLQAKINQPAKMNHTRLALHDSETRNIAKGYNDNGSVNPERYNSLLGAGGMKSTADDLLNYMELQLNESSEAVRLSHKEIWGFDMDKGSRYSFGSGWQIVKAANGKRRISQDGNLPSFSSLMVFCPELKTGIVILTNSYMIDKTGELASEILKFIEPEMP